MRDCWCDRIGRNNTGIRMIKQTIQAQLKEAMRAKNSLKLDTLRFILSELKYKEIDVQHELSDEEILEVMSREVKKRRDAIELFKNSGRDVLVKEEEVKLAIILEFLPVQMVPEQIEEVVDRAISKLGKENMGAIMREIMPEVKGKADGKLVSQIVQKKLSS